MTGRPRERTVYFLDWTFFIEGHTNVLGLWILSPLGAVLMLMACDTTESHAWVHGLLQLGSVLMSVAHVSTEGHADRCSWSVWLPEAVLIFVGLLPTEGYAGVCSPHNGRGL